MIRDVTLVNTSVVLYTVAFSFSFYQLFTQSKRCSRISLTLMLSGLIIHTLAFVLRWRMTYSLGYDYFPVTNRYESLVFFGWSLAFAWLVMRRWIHAPGFSVGMQTLAALLTASAGLSTPASTEIRPLMPALRSNWLVFHVMTCFLAYAAFAAAAFVALRFLLRSRHYLASTQEIKLADHLLYRSVSVGFFLLTLGILSGSAWAQQSWGRYWGWDPKEVWSLITWLVYAFFLHARIMRGWSGRKLALLVVLGFLAVLFTFFGVNYLPILTGLHSYA